MSLHSWDDQPTRADGAPSAHSWEDQLGAMAADEVLPDSSDCGDNDDDPADMFIEFCTELLLARELSAT
eukprot:162432-Pyramimonas_sp.AAC.1